MVPPIDFSRVERALTTPAGWVDLGLSLLAFAIGWYVDHRVRIGHDGQPDLVRVGLGGINRLLMPMVTLALLAVTYFAFRRVQAPFFLAIALPFTIALAVIRLLVYALRGMFPRATWLKTSERAISFTVWGLAALYFLGVLPEVARELEEIRIPVGRGSISVYGVLTGALVVLVTLAGALWLSGLIEKRVMGATAIDSSTRVVIAKVVRAGLIVLAVLIALQGVGIDLTLLSVFGGALGVGIGLGLQKLAANYIAGFTVLLDKSIRPGDLVTVDGRYGTVSRLTARYVVVRSLDGVEAIIPNETLVTTTVLNHSFSTREIRVALPVQVAYGTDLELALRLLETAARSEPRVLTDPNYAPAAFVVRLGESGIDLELGVWIRDPEQGQGGLRSALNLAIWRAFEANGIAIPFPQRDVRIVAQPLPPALGPTPKPT